MDLVEWCDHVLSKLIEVRSSSDALHHGLVYDSWLAEALYGKEQTAQPDYWASSRRKGLLDALDVLEEFGLIIKKKSGQVFQLDVKPLGREKVGELHTLWKGIRHYWN